MKFDIDAEAGEIGFKIQDSIYAADSLQVAAAVFEKKAEVFEEESGKGAKVVTLAARKKLKDPELELLAREFLNELLNVEYRKMVGELNKGLSGMLVTQALYAARGGDAGPPKFELTEGQKAEADRLMAEAREEAARTMPAKLPPQGPPIAPAEGR